MTNTKLNILLTLAVPVLTFGQDKFIGEYNRLMNFADTLEKPTPEYIDNRHFTINSDHTFIYYEEENPTAFNPAIRESFQGSWTSKGDTIIFGNKDFVKPKGIKINYLENQNFTGIEIIVKDFKGHDLPVDWCTIDYNSYKNLSKNKIIVKDLKYSHLTLHPRGYCADFRKCEVSVELSGLKSGTLVEVICYSSDMEMKFNYLKMILTKNILHDPSYKPLNAYSECFIKTK